MKSTIQSKLRKPIYDLRSTHSESGITLVMSIVMLATVTFVSFGLSSIILREIGVVRVILRSEPAISGANSGSEIGLYRLFRSLGGTEVSGSTSQGGASYQVKANLYSDPAAGYAFRADNGREIIVALYDAENLENKSTGYVSATINNDPGSQPLKISVVTWTDPNNPFCITTLSGSQSYTCSALNRADDRYAIFLQPTGGGSSTGNITANGQTKGVPADSPTLDVTGSGSGVQRKIQIKL